MAAAGQMAAAAAVVNQRLPGMPVNLPGMIPGGVPGLPPNVFQNNPFINQQGLNAMALQMGLGMNMANMGIPGMIPGMNAGFIPGMQFAPGFQQLQQQQAMRPLFPSAAAVVSSGISTPTNATITAGFKPAGHTPPVTPIASKPTFPAYG